MAEIQDDYFEPDEMAKPQNICKLYVKTKKPLTKTLVSG